MQTSRGGRDPALTALLVSPDREIARLFSEASAETRTFEILGELKSYPGEQTMEIRLRQIQPDVVLIDLATDLEAAETTIQYLAALQPPVQVIGLHRSNDPDVLVRSLRAGAADFLCCPFSAEAQIEAATRVRRLCAPARKAPQDFGRVLAFCSAKPGSGSSTLATQTAFSLRRLTGQRVLLADFDVMGGSIAFTLKAQATYSLLDALERSDKLDPATWGSLVVESGGIDILAAPESAPSSAPEPGRLHEVIEYARMLYDWVVIDLPCVFHRTSLFVLSEADQALLISTAELPSLHLGRRAVSMLTQLGFTKDRLQLVVNRLGKRDNLAAGDLQKIFDLPIFATFPNDYYALHRFVMKSEPPGTDTPLGKTIEQVSARLAGLLQREARQGESLLSARPALSEL